MDVTNLLAIFFLLIIYMSSKDFFPKLKLVSKATTFIYWWLMVLNTFAFIAQLNTISYLPRWNVLDLWSSISKVVFQKHHPKAKKKNPRVSFSKTST